MGQLVEVAGFLRADELLGEVSAMGAEELAELVRVLATRHSQLEAWAEDLALREDSVTPRLQPSTPAYAGAAADLYVAATGAPIPMRADGSHLETASVWGVVPYDPFDHEVHLELIEALPPGADLDFGP